MKSVALPSGPPATSKRDWSFSTAVKFSAACEANEIEVNFANKQNRFDGCIELTEKIV